MPVIYLCRYCRKFSHSDISTSIFLATNKHLTQQVKMTVFKAHALQGVTRNIHVFDGDGNYLGGTCIPSLGEDSSFGKRVPRDSTDMAPGRYVVLGNGIYQHPEEWHVIYTNSRGYSS